MLSTNTNKNRIVVIGSTNIDMVVNTERIPSPGETVLGGRFLMGSGGKGANQAVAIARLGGTVSLISKVGKDIFGQEAVQSIMSEGIEVECLLTDPDAATGVALITVDSQGENTIVVASGANAKLTAEDIKQCLGKFSDAAALLIQLEIPVETVEFAIRYAGEQGIKVILNPAPACALSASCLKLIDIITPNRIEAEALTGIKIIDERTARVAAEILREKGVRHVVITLGERGAIAIYDGRLYVAPGVKVKSVDSTAAGDAFNAALALAMVEEREFSAALEFACKAGAIATTRKGACSSLPYRGDLFRPTSIS